MVYLDNASTTKLSDDVINVMVKSYDNYFNPSSLYINAIKVNKMLQEARRQIINFLGGDVFDNLVFTGCATESNNFAIRGALKKGGKLLVSNLEHSSVYNLAKQLQNEGYSVDFINTNSNGVVDVTDFKNKLENCTIVSVIHVCNETGAVNDIKNLAEIAKGYNKNIILRWKRPDSAGRCR